MEIFNVLRNYGPLGQEHLDEISGMIEVRSLKKNEVFLKSGEVCACIGFVVEGSFRYVMDINANERNFDFAVAGEFACDYYGVLQSKPATYAIIANSACTVACLPAGKVLGLYDRDPAYQKIGRAIAEIEYCRLYERLQSIMYDSPQKRYEDLLAKMPESVLRLPQHLLANYLGITKETLSRIRAKILR